MEAALTALLLLIDLAILLQTDALCERCVASVAAATGLGGQSPSHAQRKPAQYGSFEEMKQLASLQVGEAARSLVLLMHLHVDFRGKAWKGRVFQVGEKHYFMLNRQHPGGLGLNATHVNLNPKLRPWAAFCEVNADSCRVVFCQARYACGLSNSCIGKKL